MEETSCTSDAVLKAFEEWETLSPRANTNTDTHMCEKSRQPEKDIRGYEKGYGHSTQVHTLPALRGQTPAVGSHLSKGLLTHQNSDTSRQLETVSG